MVTRPGRGGTRTAAVTGGRGGGRKGLAAQSMGTGLNTGLGATGQTTARSTGAALATRTVGAAMAETLGLRASVAVWSHCAAMSGCGLAPMAQSIPTGTHGLVHSSSTEVP